MRYWCSDTGVFHIHKPELLLLGVAHKLIATLKPSSQNGNAATEAATPTSCLLLLPIADRWLLVADC